MTHALCILIAGTVALALGAPVPPGTLVDLGGHKLHVYCTGRGTPTVVVENGLGDFSFDWVLVQSRVAQFTRICTYDRGGYAWSDPGPKPRTFAQLNLELHDALAKLGVRGPFVMVAHSFGGPVVRNFVKLYPTEVAGIVLVDSAHEGLRVGVGGGKTIRLGEGAKGAQIPPPREQLSPSDEPAIRAVDLPEEVKTANPAFNVLPAEQRALQLWAQQLPAVYAAQNSETQWSEEYFAKWLATPESAPFGDIPLLVLSRADETLKAGDTAAQQLQAERNAGQKRLVTLSQHGKQLIVNSGHNMNLEAPDAVSKAIREVVNAVRGRSRLVP